MSFLHLSLEDMLRSFHIKSDIFVFAKCKFNFNDCFLEGRYSFYITLRRLSMYGPITLCKLLMASLSWIVPPVWVSFSPPNDVGMEQRSLVCCICPVSFTKPFAPNCFPHQTLPHPASSAMTKARPCYFVLGYRLAIGKSPNEFCGEFVEIALFMVLRRCASSTTKDRHLIDWKRTRLSLPFRSW